MKYKKHTILFCSIVLVAILAQYVYVGVLKNTYYSTPQQSFELSSPRGAELLEIIQEDDCALVLYEESGAITYKVISREEKGWCSLKASSKRSASAKITDGFINKFRLNDCTALVGCIVTDKGEPLINDAEGKEMELHMLTTSSNRKSYFWFSVSREESVNNYVIINGQQVDITD